MFWTRTVFTLLLVGLFTAATWFRFDPAEDSRIECIALTVLWVILFGSIWLTTVST